MSCDGSVSLAAGEREPLAVRRYDVLGTPPPKRAASADALIDHEAAADRRLAASGVAAVEALYRRHQPMVYRFCLGLLRKPEAAADADQATWTRALIALSAPTTVVRNERPWLRAIARNECFNVLRAHRAVQSLDLNELELSAGATPEESYEIRERFESMLADLRTLSDRQRAAIVLREIGGLSSHELADTLETTPARAAGLVADARRTLTQRDALQRRRRVAL